MSFKVWAFCADTIFAITDQNYNVLIQHNDAIQTKHNISSISTKSFNSSDCNIYNSLANGLKGKI